MKKLISLFLILSILALSGNLNAKNKGAQLLIEESNGQQVKGELIAVKKNSLLLMEEKSGADLTVDVSDIKTIAVVKKSSFLKGLGFGFLIGAGAGALAGALSDQEGDDASLIQVIGIMGAMGAGVGLIVGGVAGALSGGDKKYQIEGKSDNEIKKTLAELRKKARVPDF